LGKKKIVYKNKKIKIKIKRESGFFFGCSCYREGVWGTLFVEEWG